MNAPLKRMILSVPGLEGPYKSARSTYKTFISGRAARRCFANVEEYQRALRERKDGEVTTLKTLDGITFTVRRNLKDAMILAEVFLEKGYLRYCRLAPDPVVVDVGAYIGDFTVYAAKRLNAKKVIAVEPSPKNFKLLGKNVFDNGLQDRVQILNAAVTDGNPILLSVDAPDESQMRVSAYYGGEGLKEVSGVALQDLLRDVERVDLLKVDCEGGEYLIFNTLPDQLLERILNIVFEFHEIDGFAAKLAAVKARLSQAGFSLYTHGSLISACRQ